MTWLDRHRDFTRAMAAFGTADGFGAPVPLDTRVVRLSGRARVRRQRRPRAGVVGAVGARQRADVDGQGHPPGSPTAASARCRSRAPATPTTCGWRARRRAARYLSWIGNSGPESGKLGPTQTAIAPAGGGFDAPASPEPKNAPHARRAGGGGGRRAADASTRCARARCGRRCARPAPASAPLTVLTQSAAQDPELDGSLATWSQPRIQMARRLTGGRWARVKPPRGMPAQKRGFDAVHATAAEGRRVHRRVAGHARPRARRRAHASRPRACAPRGPRR